MLKFLLALTLVLGLTACKQQDSAETLPLPVHTALVQPVAVGNGVKYSASIVPYAQVTLAFQSGGYVDSIRQVKSPSGGMRNIDQGDWVQKGTVLAVVRQQDYLDKVQQAKAQLARSQAEYEKAKLSFDRVAALYRVCFWSPGTGQRSQCGVGILLAASPVQRLDREPQRGSGRPRRAGNEWLHPRGHAIGKGGLRRP
jgi:hypothetical protein